MNAARIISPSSSTDNRRAKPTLDAGQKEPAAEPLNIAAFFARHSWPLSHQSSTAENVGAASFDRTTAHPPRSAPARERCGSSRLRSAHLDGVRVAQLVGREAAPDFCLDATWRSSTRAALADHARPRVGPSITQNSGPTGRTRRSASHGSIAVYAQASIPTSRRRSFLPCLTRIEPRRRSRSVSVSESTSLIRSPARHSTTIRALRRCP